MIQFIGVHLGAETAAVAILGRDLEITARSSTRMLNAVQDPTTGIVQIPTGEWTRAASYAIQEAYFQLPVSRRKPWGIGLAGPSGWIALDLDYKPLSPLRLTGDVPVEADFTAWLGANKREAKRISVVLAPKDFYRFTISGGLAADVTGASRQGLLLEGESQWSEPLVREKGFKISWMPPVFDSRFTTGRLSEDGIRRTSLPGGTWIVAGAHETEAALIAGGDLRERKLWVLARPGSHRRVFAYGVSATKDVTPPAGWDCVRSPMERNSILERAIDLPPDAPAEGPDASAMEENRAALERHGLEVKGVAPSRGTPEEGAALLAAMGSGIVKRWDLYYESRAGKTESSS